MACVRSCSTDPEELVSKAAYRTLSREFVRAVAAAQATLRAAGREDEAARLDGVARSSAYLRFPSRGGWGRLAHGPRAGRMADPEHGSAVRTPVPGSLGSRRRED